MSTSLKLDFPLLQVVAIFKHELLLYYNKHYFSNKHDLESKSKVTLVLYVRALFYLNLRNADLTL